MIQLTKTFTFEMAHALHHYDGACANIHGHSYRMEVTVTGEPKNDKLDPKNGMILDYGDLKRLVEDQIIHRLDHALVLSADSAPELLDTLRQSYSNLVVVDYQPTNENLLNDFAQRLSQSLPTAVHLVKIRLYETASSFAEFIA